MNAYAPQRRRPRRDYMFDVPIDMKKQMERDRERFFSIMKINPRPYELAKMACGADMSTRDMDPLWNGAEGLRGLWLPGENGEEDRLAWWLARGVSHFQGAIYLRSGTGPDMTIGRHRIYEIELNVDSQCRLYLEWKHGGDEIAEKVMNHPSLRGSFHEGDLVYNGRYLLISGGKVSLGERVSA